MYTKIVEDAIKNIRTWAILAGGSFDSQSTKITRQNQIIGKLKTAKDEFIAQYGKTDWPSYRAIEKFDQEIKSALDDLAVLQAQNVTDNDKLVSNLLARPAPKSILQPKWDNKLVSFGGTIKALGSGRVGGYLVRFSTKDDPDLSGDFFTKDTVLKCPSEIPVFYDHGRDKIIKKREIGMAIVSPENIGLWAETQLYLRDEYEKMVEKLAKDGKLGYSSGALSHLVEREPVGNGKFFISRWYIGEASLTPTPAEPRNKLTII